MTERVAYKNLPNQLDRIIVEDIDKESQGALSVLPAGTSGALWVEMPIKGGGEFVPLGQIVLEDDLEVSIFPTGRKGDSRSTTTFPDSTKRMKAVEAWNKANEYWDVDAVFASYEDIQREDSRMAQGLLAGKGELLRNHDINLNKVRKVQIII